MGRGEGCSWLQVVFYDLLAHKTADCCALGKLGNADSQIPTFLVGNPFVWGQLCSSHLELGLPEQHLAPMQPPGSPLPGDTGTPPGPGKHLGQLLLLTVMLMDSCLSWKHLEHSLFRGNLESFSPFQAETEFQLPQVFIFLEITLSSQVSISFLRRCLNLCVMGISKQNSFSPCLDPATDGPGCAGTGIPEQVEFRDVPKLLQTRNKIFASNPLPLHLCYCFPG